MSLRGLRAVGPLCRAVGRASSTSILETAPESEELISALHCVQTMLAALSNPTSNPVCRCEVPSTAYAACQDRDALTLRDSPAAAAEPDDCKDREHIGPERLKSEGLFPDWRASARSP